MNKHYSLCHFVHKHLAMNKPACGLFGDHFTSRNGMYFFCPTNNLKLRFWSFSLKWQDCKALNTPSVSVKVHWNALWPSKIGPSRIPTRHHWPNVFNLTLTLTLGVHPLSVHMVWLWLWHSISYNPFLWIKSLWTALDGGCIFHATLINV